MAGEIENKPFDEISFSEVLLDYLVLTQPNLQQISEINKIIGSDADAVFAEHGLSSDGKDKQTTYAIRGSLITKASVTESGITITDFSISDVRKVVLQSMPTGVRRLGVLGPATPQRANQRRLSLEVHVRHEKEALILTATSDSEAFNLFYRTLRSAIAGLRK